MSGRILIVALGVLMLACVGSTARAVSWNAFEDAQFSGISLDEPLQVDTLDYTLSIADNATITIGSGTYEVSWVQAFYVVSGEPGGVFTASDGPDNAWSWESKVSGGGQISGWNGEGNNRIGAGQSRTFHFGSLDPGRRPIISAFHVAYQDGSNTITGWWKDPAKSLAAVPEPSATICLGLLLTAFGGLWAKKSSSRLFAPGSPARQNCR